MKTKPGSIFQGKIRIAQGGARWHLSPTLYALNIQAIKKHFTLRASPWIFFLRMYLIQKWTKELTACTILFAGKNNLLNANPKSLEKRSVKERCGRKRRYDIPHTKNFLIYALIWAQKKAKKRKREESWSVTLFFLKLFYPDSEI